MGGKPLVHNGIAHNGALLRAQHGVGRVGPIGWVVHAAVPIVVAVLRVARYKQPVGRAVHAIQRAHGAPEDARGISFHRAAGRNAHIVLARHRAFARRRGEGDNARGAVYRVIGIFCFFLPSAICAQNLHFHRGIIQLRKGKMILRVFLCAQKLLGKFWLNKVQVLILRAAARRCLGNGEQRYSSCVPYRARRRAVKHCKPRAVYDVQFISKLPGAAACVRHAAIYFLFAQIQFRSCMYKKFAVLPSGKHAVDACGVLRYGFISHTLTHLARHIAYHVLPVGAAAFIHIGRAVSVIYAIELIHI